MYRADYTFNFIGTNVLLSRLKEGFPLCAVNTGEEVLRGYPCNIVVGLDQQQVIEG